FLVENYFPAMMGLDSGHQQHQGCGPGNQGARHGCSSWVKEISSPEGRKLARKTQQKKEKISKTQRLQPLAAGQNAECRFATGCLKPISSHRRPASPAPRG